MKKPILNRLAAAAVLLASLMFMPCVLAEVYAGTTIAVESVLAEAQADGVLESLCVQAGQTVTAGERIGEIRATKVFAVQDGMVALQYVDAGDTVSGTILEIMPLRRYTIYCTAEDAYESPEAMRIHSGETLYVKCKADGTHRAIGIVTSITENEYQVETIGGELYVGEVVRLYRDADFKGSQRVGVGTVVESSTESYEADGTLVQLNVEAGESVERGQLLYAYVSGESPILSAPIGGIVASVSAAQGDRLSDGQSVAEIVPMEAIRIEIQVDESHASRITEGMSVRWQYKGDETSHTGIVESIASDATETGYAVRIRSESPLTRLGSVVEVRVGE